MTSLLLNGFSEVHVSLKINGIGSCFPRSTQPHVKIVPCTLTATNKRQFHFYFLVFLGELCQNDAKKVRGKSLCLTHDDSIHLNPCKQRILESSELLHKTNTELPHVLQWFSGSQSGWGT